MLEANRQDIIQLQVTRPSPIITIRPSFGEPVQIVEPSLLLQPENWSRVSLTYDFRNGIEFAAANMDIARQQNFANKEDMGRVNWLRLASYHNRGIVYPELPEVKPEDRAQAIAYMKRTDVYWDYCDNWLAQ